MMHTKVHCMSKCPIRDRCHTVTNLAISYGVATDPKTKYVSDSFFRAHIFRIIKKIKLINDKGVD